MKNILLKIWRWACREKWVYVGDGIEIEMSCITGPMPHHFAMRKMAGFGATGVTHCIIDDTGLHNTFGSLPANDAFVKLCMRSIWNHIGRGVRP